MEQLLIIIDVVVCLALIGLILIQHGKGASMGASFGAGASQTVFGSSGSASFLVKLTAVLAAVFFAVSLILSYLALKEHNGAAAINMPVPTKTIPVKKSQKPNTSTVPVIETTGTKKETKTESKQQSNKK